MISAAVHAAVVGAVAWIFLRPADNEIVVALDRASLELYSRERPADVLAVRVSDLKDPEPEILKPESGTPPAAIDLPDASPPAAIREIAWPDVKPPAESFEVTAESDVRLDAPPSPLKPIVPEYPRAARLRGEEGAVELKFRVSEIGEASELSVLNSSGFPDLDTAAVRAVSSARFHPASSDGAPVSAAARLTLVFRLRD